MEFVAVGMAVVFVAHALMVVLAVALTPKTMKMKAWK
jgi:hypothetical protein